MRTLRLLLLLAAGPLFVGCAMLDDTPPDRPPSLIAGGYVGKPLQELEMRWSEPMELGAAAGGQKATWRFDQFNFAGCSVTVHTDAGGIIRKVDWTPGCGPKGTATITSAAE
ncbi:MAG TPA: hypothetical protein VMU52_01800 [Steroidobacteraceae bacterium]|nr:hypothetical protein [Steroidobacteraceae bacterium]